MMKVQGQRFKVQRPYDVPRAGVATTNVLIGLLIVVALAAGTLAVLRMDPWGERSSEQPDAAAAAIDPALIKYQQVGQIPVPLGRPRALAAAPDDRIYVGGDKALCVLTLDGKKEAEFALDGEPLCLALGGSDHSVPGRLYVGVDDHVEVLDLQGKRLESWKTLGEKAVLTSIAVAEHDVFVADAGNRIVWHYDGSGELKDRIGAPDKARKIPGFQVPSPYFDLAIAPDGLLYVVNPLALRLEAYTFGGDLEWHWGKSSSEIDGFFGCCNPAHFAILSDGRFVTAEKGIPRIKIYSAQGRFECVVAGPEQMRATAADLAVDRRDRILVLDPDAAGACVRIFARKDVPFGGEQ